MNDLFNLVYRILTSGINRYDWDYESLPKEQVFDTVMDEAKDGGFDFSQYTYDDIWKTIDLALSVFLSGSQEQGEELPDSEFMPAEDVPFDMGQIPYWGEPKDMFTRDWIRQNNAQDGSKFEIGNYVLNWENYGREQVPHLILDKQQGESGWEYRLDNGYWADEDWLEEVDGLFPDTYKGEPRRASIWDRYHRNLSPKIFHNDKLKRSIQKFIETKVYEAFKKHFGFDCENYLELYLTGSLTTQQYSSHSDCDISIFPQYDIWPNKQSHPDEFKWELVRLVVDKLDGIYLPGSQHPLQCFIQPPDVEPDDIFKDGERAAWSFSQHDWEVRPIRHRAIKIKDELPSLYARAYQIAEKLSGLIDTDPEAAKDLYKRLHKQRRQDTNEYGKGDLSESNLTYKLLDRLGLFARLREIGVKIAAMPQVPEWEGNPPDLFDLPIDYDQGLQLRNMRSFKPGDKVRGYTNRLAGDETFSGTIGKVGDQEVWVDFDMPSQDGKLGGWFWPSDLDPVGDYWPDCLPESFSKVAKDGYYDDDGNWVEGYYDDEGYWHDGQRTMKELNPYDDIYEFTNAIPKDQPYPSNQWYYPGNTDHDQPLDYQVAMPIMREADEYLKDHYKEMTVDDFYKYASTVMQKISEAWKQLPVDMYHPEYYPSTPWEELPEHQQRMNDQEEYSQRVNYQEDRWDYQRKMDPGDIETYTDAFQEWRDFWNKKIVINQVQKMTVDIPKLLGSLEDLKRIDFNNQQDVLKALTSSKEFSDNIQSLMRPVNDLYSYMNRGYGDEFYADSTDVIRGLVGKKAEFLRFLGQLTGNLGNYFATIYTSRNNKDEARKEWLKTMDAIESTLMNLSGHNTSEENTQLQFEAKAPPCSPVMVDMEIEAPDEGQEEDYTIPQQEPMLIPAKIAQELQYAYDNEPHGWKMLNVSDDGTLFSPTQGTEWPVGKALYIFDDEGHELSDEELEGLRRGSFGIHLVPEGDWEELYGYMDEKSVLVKCRIFKKFWEGSTSHGRGLIAQKAKPVLAVGNNKQLLLKVANKYGIDTEFAGEDYQQFEWEDQENFPGLKMVDTGSAIGGGKYKGFDFTQRGRSTPQWQVIKDGQIVATIDYSVGGDKKYNVDSVDMSQNVLGFIKEFFEYMRSEGYEVDRPPPEIDKNTESIYSFETLKERWENEEALRNGEGDDEEGYGKWYPPNPEHIDAYDEDEYGLALWDPYDFRWTELTVRDWPSLVHEIFLHLADEDPKSLAEMLSWIKDVTDAYVKEGVQDIEAAPDLTQLIQNEVDSWQAVQSQGGGYYEEDQTLESIDWGAVEAFVTYFQGYHPEQQQMFNPQRSEWEKPYTDYSEVQYNPEEGYQGTLSRVAAHGLPESGTIVFPGGRIVQWTEPDFEEGWFNVLGDDRNQYNIATYPQTKAFNNQEYTVEMVETSQDKWDDVVIYGAYSPEIQKWVQMNDDLDRLNEMERFPYDDGSLQYGLGPEEFVDWDNFNYSDEYSGGPWGRPRRSNDEEAGWMPWFDIGEIVSYKGHDGPVIGAIEDKRMAYNEYDEALGWEFKVNGWWHREVDLDEANEAGQLFSQEGFEGEPRRSAYNDYSDEEIRQFEIPPLVDAWDFGLQTYDELWPHRDLVPPPTQGGEVYSSEPTLDVEGNEEDIYRVVMIDPYEIVMESADRERYIRIKTEDWDHYAGVYGFKRIAKEPGQDTIVDLDDYGINQQVLPHRDTPFPPKEIGERYESLGQGGESWDIYTVESLEPYITLDNFGSGQGNHTLNIPPHLWDSYVQIWGLRKIGGHETIFVVYDLNNDTIELDTNEREATDGNQILGEYTGSDILLYPTSDHYVNGDYFKKLWAHSFHDKPLNEVYIVTNGEAAKLPTKPYRRMRTLKSKVSKWGDIMDKARRYMDEGRINVDVNNWEKDPVTGNIQNYVHSTSDGDSGQWETELWRDDPNSNAITRWNCNCPWGDVSWGRTRQFKKFEGRPCAHVLATHWLTQGGKPPEEEGGEPPSGPQQQGPTSPVGEQNQTPNIPGSVNLNEPTVNQPTPVVNEAPANPMIKSVPQMPGQTPYGLPGAFSKVASNQIPFIATSDEVGGYEDGLLTIDIIGEEIHLGFDTQGHGIEWFVGNIYGFQEGHTTGYWINTNEPDELVLDQQGEDMVLQFSDVDYTVKRDDFWNSFDFNFKQSKIAALFQNGDKVRVKPDVQLMGVDRDERTHLIGPNRVGEVIYCDEDDCVLIFPLNDSKATEPHLVRVETTPDTVQHAPGNAKPFTSSV